MSYCWALPSCSVWGARTPRSNGTSRLKILLAGMYSAARSIPVLAGPALFPKRQDHHVSTVAMQNNDLHSLQMLLAAEQQGLLDGLEVGGPGHFRHPPAMDCVVELRLALPQKHQHKASKTSYSNAEDIGLVFVTTCATE